MSTRTRPRSTRAAERDGDGAALRPKRSGASEAAQMTVTTIPVDWSFAGVAQTPASVVMDVPSSATAAAPLVVLLHGTSGNINDMSDPAQSPGFNYEKFAPGHIVDRGWHAYPNAGY